MIKLTALAEGADHPEITLERRDILRFILVEPTKRLIGEVEQHVY